jgi:glycosyltransferase involved in cell wall biosynthesis
MSVSLDAASAEEIGPEVGCHAPSQGRRPRLQGSPIRVCFLLDRLRPAGTEMQVLALIRHLDRRVVEPYLCLLDGEDEISRSLEPSDCPVLRLGVFAIKSPKGIVGAWRFGRWLRRERIDILQVYFVQSATLGALVGRLVGVPHILRVRNNVGHWMTPAMCWRFRWINRLVTRIITNSEAGRESAIVQERASPHSIIVVENCVDFDRFPPRPNPGRFGHGGTRRVGIVANLRRVKGLDVFLDAAVRVRAVEPDVVFSIAGDSGREGIRPELERQVAALGLSSHVEFLGRVADIPAFLNTLDVGVLSSRAEGTSNALIEYMAAGLPIVVTAVGGNVALIRDGVDGIVVPPEDPDRLGAAIVRLLRSPHEASGLAEAAHRFVRERFGDRAAGATLEQCYLQLQKVALHD